MNVPPELLTFFCCYNFLHNRVLIFSRHKFLLRLRTYGCIGLFVLSVFAVCTGGGWGVGGGGWKEADGTLFICPIGFLSRVKHRKSTRLVHGSTSNTQPSFIDFSCTEDFARARLRGHVYLHFINVLLPQY